MVDSSSLKTVTEKNPYIIIERRKKNRHLCFFVVSKMNFKEYIVWVLTVRVNNIKKIKVFLVSLLYFSFFPRKLVGTIILTKANNIYCALKYYKLYHQSEVSFYSFPFIIKKKKRIMN